jgi:superoxide dismutase, Cu-Zn family
MSMHRFALGVFCASAIAVAATTYGCSDDGAETPPEFDAGNPTRQNDSGGTSSSGGSSGDATTDGAVAKLKAKALIAATGVPDAGSPSGSVDFEESNGMIVANVTINGATTGMHAVHIHDGTSCANSTDPDAGLAGFAAMAGPHWNPGDAGHGLPTNPVHHAGDMGNMSVDGTGAGTLTLNMTGFNIQPDAGILSAIGHAVVFHQGTDDGTGTNGNAGPRPGCGIIIDVAQ